MGRIFRFWSCILSLPCCILCRNTQLMATPKTQIVLDMGYTLYTATVIILYQNGMKQEENCDMIGMKKVQMRYRHWITANVPWTRRVSTFPIRRWMCI